MPAGTQKQPLTSKLAVAVYYALTRAYLIAYRVDYSITVATLPERMLILDTDRGKEILRQREDLESLVEAYKKGLIKEKY